MAKINKTDNVMMTAVFACSNTEKKVTQALKNKLDHSNKKMRITQKDMEEDIAELMDLCEGNEKLQVKTKQCYKMFKSLQQDYAIFFSDEDDLDAARDYYSKIETGQLNSVKGRIKLYRYLRAFLRHIIHGRKKN